MIKLFFKNSFFFFIVQIVSYVVSFFLLPLYTAQLSRADYGALEMLGVVGLIINTVAALQIQQGVARSLPDRNFTDPVAKTKLVSTGFTFSLLAFTAYTVAGLLFHEQLCLWLLGDRAYLRAFDLSMVYNWLLGVASYMQMLKVYQMEGKQSAVASICSVFVSIPLTVFLVLVVRWGIVGILLANIAGQLIILLLLFRSNLKHLVFKIDNKLLKSMLRFSLPLVFSSLAYSSWNFIDRIIMKQFLSLEDLGLFSVAAKFNVPFAALLSIFETAFFPIVINQHHKFQTPAKIQKLAALLLFFVVLLWLVVCLFAKQVVQLMVARDFLAAWPLVGWAIGAMICTRLGFFAPGIAIAKKTKYFIYIIICTSVVNAALNYFLIPRLGILGAPIATFTSGILYLIAYFYISQKLYKIPYNFFSFAFVLVIIVSSIFFIQYAEPVVTTASWLAIKAALFLVLGFILYKLLIQKNLEQLLYYLVTRKLRRRKTPD